MCRCTIGVEKISILELADVYYEDTTGFAWNLYVSGNFSYIATGRTGLAVMNISNPTNPSAPYYEDTNGDALGVYVRNDYAYVADAGSGLAVIDVSDPTDLGSPIYMDTTGFSTNVYVSGDYAYIADGESGLAIIDISDPTNPGNPIYEDTISYAHDIHVSGNYSFVGDHIGLAVINISDPTNPGAPIYMETSGQAWGVYISGDYAYVADGISGLAVIDISDPTNPGNPVYEDTLSDARAVYVSGDYAYVADYEEGLAVIDISDPTNPSAPAYQDTIGLAYGVHVKGNYAYVANGYYGLAVLDTDIGSFTPTTASTITTTTTTTTITITTTETTTPINGAEPDPAMAILIASGGAVMVIAVASLFIGRKRKPRAPAYVRPPKPPPMFPVIEEEAPELKKGVQALRGCAIVGGKFEYKVKIINNTEFVIFDITVSIISFPEVCMELQESPTKKIPKIEPGGFRSPQFTLNPTEDCVEGEIVASVSYMDHKHDLEMIEVEPYTIRSVCDLLTPLESSLEDFDFMLGNMTATSEKNIFNWNPEVLYLKAKSLLSAKNFYIIEAKDEKIDGEFRGTIRGLAEGKYTGKRVALRLIISGLANGTQANVEIEGLGEDIAMLPTTIDEISKGIISWTCMNCGGALDSNEVTRIKSGENIECRYCRHIMTIDLYRR